MRPIHKSLLLPVLAVGLMTAGFRNIPYLTGNEVMQKVKDTQTADAEVDIVKMVTIDDKGDSVTREILSVAQKDDKGNLRYLMRILAPAKDKGISFLVLENTTGEADQYVYLPAVSPRPQKIEGASRSGSFLGTDFTYEDLRKEKPGEWKYDRLDDEKVEGTDCYVIMATPADKNREKITGYTYRFLYVDKATFVIRRVEFLDSKQKIVKQFDAFDYQPTNGGVQRPRRGVMTNLAKKSNTVMTLTNLRVNKPVDEKLFFTLDTMQKWGPEQEKLVEEMKAIPAAKTP